MSSEPPFKDEDPCWGWVNGFTESYLLAALFPCDDCHRPTDPEWWFRSGGLCGDCLAGYGWPLMKIEGS